MTKEINRVGKYFIFPQKRDLKGYLRQRSQQQGAFHDWLLFDGGATHGCTVKLFLRQAIGYHCASHWCPVCTWAVPTAGDVSLRQMLRHLP